MFIDFVTLLLVNMVAGLVLLAAYLYAGLEREDQAAWAPGFAIAGLVAFAFGGYMTLSWPLPGPYNMAFGEMSVLFGVLFLGAAWALARGWNLRCLALYALFAGAAAVALGARIIDLKLTKSPLLSGIGFILSGAAGMLAAPTLAWFTGNRPVRALGALALLAAAAVWALTGSLCYWGHMQSFQHWLPPLMRSAGGY